MKNKVSYMLTAIVSMLFAANVMAGPSYGGVKWIDFRDDAFTKAEKTYTPVLLFVTAGWCKYCKDMEETTFKDPAIAKYIKRNFITVTATPDQYSLVRKYNITALPAVLVLDSKGQVIDEFSGYRNKKDTMKILMHAYRQHQLT